MPPEGESAVVGKACRRRRSGFRCVSCDGSITGLLLLFLLLHELLFVAGSEGVVNVCLEQRFSDLIQLELQFVQVVMQAEVEDFLDRAELKFRHESPGEFLGVVRKTSFSNA